MSPCPLWTAREIVGHLIDGQAQIMWLLTGRGPPWQPTTELAAVAGPDPATTWHDTEREVTGVLTGLDLQAGRWMA